MLLPMNDEPPPLISLKTLLRALKNEKLPPNQRPKPILFSQRLPATVTHSVKIGIFANLIQEPARESHLKHKHRDC